jgi:translation initiation factor IF-1
MELYAFSLALGGAGLGVMGAIGLGHLAGGGHGHGDGHGHGHHGHGHQGHHGHGANGGQAHAPHAHDASAPHAHHAPAHHGHAAHGHAQHGSAQHGSAQHGSAQHAGAAHTETTFGDLATRAAWSLLSPRVVFSLLVGFGATGLLLGHVDGVPGWLRLALAVIGGLAFERLAVGPLWNALFGFASHPATMLEQVLFDEVQAVSGFDQRGQGLVALELDGQVVQVLATLRADDRAAGVRVRAGDRVRVEEVDVERHRCVVTRVG